MEKKFINTLKMVNQKIKDFFFQKKIFYPCCNGFHHTKIMLTVASFYSKLLTLVKSQKADFLMPKLKSSMHYS